MYQWKIKKIKWAANVTSAHTCTHSTRTPTTHTRVHDDKVKKKSRRHEWIKEKKKNKKKKVYCIHIDNSNNIIITDKKYTGERQSILFNSCCVRDFRIRAAYARMFVPHSHKNFYWNCERISFWNPTMILIWFHSIAFISWSDLFCFSFSLSIFPFW